MPPVSELKPVKPEPGRPLYHAVKDAVRTAIDSGRFAPGAQLPSTKALSTQLNVSLVTVHRALQELVSSGVLRRGQGRGTFVHEDYASRAESTTGMRFGLVFHAESSLADFFHGHVLEGVRQGAATIGADLVILRFGEDWRKECQGFLYVNPLEDQLDRSPWFGRSAAIGNGYAKSKSPHLPPVVVVGASFKRDHAVTVDCDNEDLAIQAVNHLVSQGHRRIGYVGGADLVSNSVDRWNGFRKACEAHRIPITDRFVLRSKSWRLEPDEKTDLMAVLGQRERPTAVFAAGYYFALDVYSAAGQIGRSIPRDLSVISVDDPPSADHLSPPLTTLRQPLEEMGRLAAHALFNVVNAPSERSPQALLRASLIPRQSVAPPADRR